MDEKSDTKQLTRGIDDALLQANMLTYRLPAEISVATSRTHVVDQFQSQTYAPSQRMILNSQTGSAFINGRESWLEFTVKGLTTAGGIPATTDADWGSGSACNVINEVLVKARTGREICRLENANLANKIMDQWNCPAGWFNTAGSVQGYGTIATTGGMVAEVVTINGVTGSRYCIPLHRIIPFFDQKRLLPPAVMEGLQIEFLLESFNNALNVSTPGDAATYQISSPEIHWSTTTLADQFRRKVLEISAKSGLYLLHKELFHQQTSLIANTTAQANYDIKMAASKALMAMVITRNNANVDVKSNVDSMGSAVADYKTAIAHIGANYYPQQRLDSVSGATGFQEVFYMNALNCFNKDTQCWNPPATSLVGYKSGETVNAVGTTVASAVHCVKLNKSGVTDLDGMVINNSRALVFDISYQSAGSYARRLDSYLQHVRAVQIFPNNVTVRD